MFEVVIRKDGRDLKSKHANTLDGAETLRDQAIESGRADSVRVMRITAQLYRKFKSETI